MTWYIVVDDAGGLEYDVDVEVPRCEADHVDGGVCQARLRANGHCPYEGNHLVHLRMPERNPYR